MSDRCYLMDLERTIRSGVATYWKPGKQGYTSSIEEAGRYPKLEAYDIAESDFDELTVVIKDYIVDSLY